MRALLIGLWCLVTLGCLVTFPPPESTDSGSDSATDAPQPPDCLRFVDGRLDSAGDGTSWGEAFTGLVEGLAAAQTAAQTKGRCELWVASGTYYVNELALAPQVVLRGGFAGTETDAGERDPFVAPTVLSGCADPTCATQAEHVVIGADDATLDSVVISGGKSASGGAGILCDGVSPIFTAIVLVGNSTEGDGGGMLVRGNAAVSLSSTVISNNSATGSGGGLAVVDGASVSCHKCTIAENTAASGGGAHASGSAALSFLAGSLSQNTADDPGGAIHAVNATVLLEQTVLASNSAREGGGIYASGGELTLESVALLSNHGTVGGGIVGRGAPRLALHGVTLLDNESGEGGGASLTVSDTGTAELASAIVYGGSSPDVLFSGATLRAEHCLTREALAGTGNKMGEPGLFGERWSAAIESISPLAGGGVTALELDVEGAAPVFTLGVLVRAEFPANSPYHPVFIDRAGALLLGGDASELAAGASVVVFDLGPTAESACVDAGDGLLSPSLDLRGQERHDAQAKDQFDCSGVSVDCVSYADIGAVEWTP